MSSIGPQLPPPSPASRKRMPDRDTPSPPAKHPRSRGPSSPPNDQEIRLSDSDPDPAPTATPSSDPSSSSSDDDYGPALPSSSSAAPRPTGPSLPAAQPAPQRDTWMLAPPPSTGYSERDPTRLRARKFASRPSAQQPGDPPSAMWTETPQEKLRRQTDALLGRGDPSASADPASSERDARRRERDRRIAESVEAARGKSLYDEHREKRRRDGGGVARAAADEDDPSKRAFDREKDMAVGGRIGSKAREELVSKSANFGGRFHKGSFL
ncbi:uncharacterized protein UV8b_02196 [Ustilaginoidea virens]|uniref:DUF3752 domain-containing protein n=2 Tax=Ustilaginoidea virens TaxID=1159556 RepID=A0A8E5HMG2_USTVR|nr:uncharacterized protein UV8b_02196 [Ustilaginoidea virens]QUC17955.1 hypothetical protein UV8b_02196 [Ustilaginoidea virens]